VDCVGDTVVRCLLRVSGAACARCLHPTTSAMCVLPGEEHLVGLFVNSRAELVCVPRVVLRTTDVAVSSCVGAGDPVVSLRPHQKRSICWMAEIETSRGEVRYDTTLPIASEWGIDLDHERVVRRSSPRVARLRGGVLADWAGSGKTATALEFCASHAASAADRRAVESGEGVPYAKGTLIIVPVHLIDHWIGNATTFVPRENVLPLVSARDLRQYNLGDVRDATVVITTAQFLKSSKIYQQVVETTVQETLGVDARHARSPAAVAAFGRSVLQHSAAEFGRAPPIVECLHWHRIVVDEVHELVAAHPRAWRLIVGLRTRFAWGITATPELWYEEARAHYWHLATEEWEHRPQHHPVMLQKVVEACVRMTRPMVDAYAPPTARAVALRPLATQQAGHGDTTSGYDDAAVPSSVRMDDAADPHPERDCSEATADGGERDARHTSCGLRQTVLEETSFEGTDDMEVCDLHAVRREIDSTVACLQREVDADKDGEREELCMAVRAVQQRGDRYMRCLEELYGGTADVCPVCSDAPCSVVTECAHTFCRSCIERCRPLCPVCRQPHGRLRGVLLNGSVKLEAIVSHCACIGEPCIVYTQWKSVRRKIAAALRGSGLTVVTLDGNATQRRNGLELLKRSNAVLALSFEEPFAGLHVPHVRHVVFAHSLLADREHIDNMEYQAIARVARWGQARQVQVATFVIADSAEDDFWKATHL
jgi:hypothetical protein